MILEILSVLPFLLFFIYMVICTYTDIRNNTISLYLSIIFLLLSFIINLFHLSLSLYNIGDIVLSFIPGFITLLIGKLSNESIGYGDGIIFLLAGSYLGFWKCIGLVFFSMFFSSLFSLFLIIRRKNLKQSFPLSPFILLGFFIQKAIEYTYI